VITAETHQLPGHDLADIHEVVNEPVFLPVYAVDLPAGLTLPLALGIICHCIFQLLLKVLYDFLYHVPALWGLFILQLTF
jgi:hypothetical protein